MCERTGDFYIGSIVDLIDINYSIVGQQQQLTVRCHAYSVALGVNAADCACRSIYCSFSTLQVSTEYTRGVPNRQTATAAKTINVYLLLAAHRVT